jgi:hypothetical protein
LNSFEWRVFDRFCVTVCCGTSANGASYPQATQTRRCDDLDQDPPPERLGRGSAAGGEFSCGKLCAD